METRTSDHLYKRIWHAQFYKCTYLIKDPEIVQKHHNASFLALHCSKTKHCLFPGFFQIYKIFQTPVYMLSNYFDSRVESVSCALSAGSVPVCLWSGQHDVLIHSLYGLCTSYSLCTAMTSEHSCLDIHHAPLTLSYFWLHLSTGPATCPAIRAQTCEPFLPLWLKTSSWILKMCLFVQVFG